MSNYALSKVLPLGVLTGSRAFNCSTEQSDWDIVITKSNLPPYKPSCNWIITEFYKDSCVGGSKRS